MVNTNLLIDFSFACDKQLSEVYKMIREASGDRYFKQHLIDAVITSKEIIYTINQAINGRESDKVSSSCILRDLEDAIDNGFIIKSYETHKQIEKTIKYLEVFEAMLLDLLPDIENHYFISATINIEIMKCLSEIII